MIRTLDSLTERLAATGMQGDDVTDVIAGACLDEAAIAHHISRRDDRYTRNLVHRSELFDVILLCWRPGHATPIHDHSGQRGWVRVLAGTMEEVAFDPALPLRTPDLAGMASSEPVELVESGRVVAPAGEAVLAVDRVRAIHRITCLDGGQGDLAVTLHVYSRPHDCCDVFDPETGVRARRRLSFDTAPPDTPSA